jgi:hypothetical protein
VREVKTRDGSHAGWLRVEVSLRAFSDLYQKVVQNLGAGASVSLYRSDYTLMARWPHADALIGVRNLASAIQNIIETQQLSQGVLVTDSERLTESNSTELRMVSVRRVEQFPLIVTSVITRNWRSCCWRLGPGGYYALTRAYSLS